VIILFGTRRMRKPLGNVMMLCQRCQRPSAHALFKLHTWFTLFFIPIFPFSVKYATACPMCGVGTQVDKAHAEHLASVGGQQAAAPVEMTPDGPITPYPSVEAMPAPHSQPVVGADPDRNPVTAPEMAGSAGDGPPGEGWWLASDEKWYPPELHPDAT